MTRKLFILVILILVSVPALAQEVGSVPPFNQEEREFRVLPANGSSLTPEEQNVIEAIIDDFRVNDDAGISLQYFPAIATDGSGNFVITWYDYRNSNSDIYAQRYNSAGTPQGSNFQVNTDTADDGQYYSAIAMDVSGNFVITWQDYRYGMSDIYAQRYDSAGTSLGSNFQVNTDDGTAGQYDPAIGIDGSGSFVITWQDYRNVNSDIYAQRYNSAGTPLDSNFQVNTDAGTALQYSLAIVMDVSGNFVITWFDERNGNYDIYAQRYNSAGIPLDSNFQVNTDAETAEQFDPVIGMDVSGNFVIIWCDLRNGMSDIYAQRYNFTGTPVGSNFKVNTDAGTAIQVNPAIAMDDSGNFVITWQDERNGNYDIYAQRYKSSGNPWGGNYLVPNPLYAVYGQEAPSVELDGSNIYFTWHDDRNGNWDIYAKLVNWMWPDICGDANGDGSVTVSDVVHLINYLFKGGPAPECPPSPYLSCADVNGDGQVTVSDVVYLINYLFKGGPPPSC